MAYGILIGQSSEDSGCGAVKILRERSRCSAVTTTFAVTSSHRSNSEVLLKCTSFLLLSADQFRNDHSATSSTFSPSLSADPPILLFPVTAGKMAVIGAITARVIVNRHPAQEYRCLSSDSNAIEGPNVNTVYIEVKPEGIFHFRIDIAEAFAWDGTDTVSVEVQLNGKLIRAGCCRKAHRNEDGSWSLEISGVYKKRGDEIKKIKWKFEKLNNRECMDSHISMIVQGND